MATGYSLVHRIRHDFDLPRESAVYHSAVGLYWQLSSATMQRHYNDLKVSAIIYNIT